ncbi:MAG: winged helix-turn-helix domain-containing protein [Candidatus Nitrosopolaris sp.]|jgi:predicted transcriptional regulator
MLAKVRMENQAHTTQQHIKNRSRLDVIAAILSELSRREATKTRIMYGAFLSSTQMREYVPFLLKNGLLMKVEQSIYKITEKGMRLLTLCDELNNMIGDKERYRVYE